jgi:hypothetical protein
MALDDLVPEAAGETSRDRERWTGVYIGVLAVLLAICAMGGGNAAKDATLNNIAAANTWAFFQAKNMRRHILRVRVDEMQLKLASEPELPPTARAAIEAKIAEYKKQDDILTRDPEREPGEREGLDQLWERGKALEVERDIAMQQDPYFDYGEALLQIAIVLASISIITRGTFLLAASAFLGIGGAILTLNGFTLAFTLPWL